MLDDTVEVTVDGIPCRARVTHYQPREEGSGSGEPRSYAHIHPPVEEELEYELLDRKGHRAAFLDDIADKKNLWPNITNTVKAALCK
tara:strand:+ start:693 stop:953 length:261 start_codon:yes stop_codon:yes gene_type:complete